ncbi:MAG TPA: hypothetical protein VEF04_06125, partial [Blastocatellia bacterium]|nr:hypothetical protein [Blastocatellia bacterium]
MLKLKQLLSLLSLLFFSFVFVQAQDVDRDSRVAQWNSLQPASGKFVRYVDTRNGFSFLRPEPWKEGRSENGSPLFRPDQGGVGMVVAVESIPDGLGIASYATASLQQLRKQNISPDSLLIRPVTIGGFEGREITFALESEDGKPLRQTMWITAIGPRAYVFTFVTSEAEIQNHEPLFKRSMLSIKFGTPGKSFDSFESMRAAFASANAEGSDVEVNLISESVRTAKETSSTAINQLVALAAKSPVAVIDLLLDQDPQVRIAASSALGQVSDARVLDALFWALKDKDVY